jgi:hypothetical protein
MGSLLKKLGYYHYALLKESVIKPTPEYTGYVSGSAYHITSIKKK